MKIILLLLVSFFFLYSINTKAQGEETVLNYLFLFGQIQVPSNEGLTYTLTTQGTNWDLDVENQEFPISIDADLEMASIIINGSTASEPSEQEPGAWKGFVFPWMNSPYERTDSIVYGFYKVTYMFNISETQGSDYFYINLRDCKFNQLSGFVSGGYTPDFYIRYDYSENIFQWKRSGDWSVPISTGEVLNVWDMCNNGISPVTSYFEDFWDHALIMTDTEDDHPRIVWGPHPSFSATHYKIYRAMSENPANPLSLNYTLKATVSSSTYSYVDSDILYGASPVVYVYYYIKAYNSNSNTYSDRTNIVNTVGGNAPTKNVTLQEINQVTEFSISQNYPSPFNPSTKITYSLLEDSKIQIKVYDMLGTEVSELVNETKLAGFYETTFDASELCSGVYIYRITALNGERILFSESKGMLLMK